MDEHTSQPEYRPAPDFHPYQVADALLGISQALEQLLNEGPGTDRDWTPETRAALCGLVWAQQHFMRGLHEWLVNIENLTSIHLPLDAEDFETHHIHHFREGAADEVREPAPLYSVN